MSKKKPKFYVVWEGVKPGIYTTWEQCNAQVFGFAGAKFKSYESKAEAEAAYSEGQAGNWGNTGNASNSVKPNKILKSR